MIPIEVSGEIPGFPQSRGLAQLHGGGPACIGGGLAFLVASLTPLPAAVPLSAIIAALTMAAIAGILFGLWPAWRAARMDPVVALRYE